LLDLFSHIPTQVSEAQVTKKKEQHSDKASTSRLT
jgi:hypothetical protein